MIIDYMIKKHGIENCLILIGSSNSLTERTPYTFGKRKKMVHLLYPNIKVLPLPDVEPELELYNDNTNNLWLDSVEKIEKDLNTKFIFYGGSMEDLKVLSERFPTEVAIDRTTKGKNISGTMIRKNIRDNKINLIDRLVDKKIALNILTK